jgi:large subunit ribosomal protein L30
MEVYLNSLDSNIIELDLSKKSLTKLPNLDKFKSLKELHCYINQLTSLPEKLPNSLEILCCFTDHLTSIPDTLPSTLLILHCGYNELTCLPNTLPKSLKLLYCSYNKLTSLSENLPNSLKALYCSDNELTSLPDRLPSSLRWLYCDNNQLTSLPDNLQNSLQILNLTGNTLLQKKYPLLNLNGNFFRIYKTQKEYIQEINSKLRIQERLKIINSKNILLEKYEQRIMHPSKLEFLNGVETVEEIDRLMESYLRYL